MAIGRVAKSKLENNLRLKVEEMGLSTQAETRHIQQLTGKAVQFSEEYDSRIMARGNVLLASFRYDTMDDIDQKIDIALKKRERTNDKRSKNKQNI